MSRSLPFQTGRLSGAGGSASSRARQTAKIAAVAVFLGAALVLPTGSAGASTFTVTNVNSSGPGSLNQAIANATSHPGADTITFASSTNHHVLPDPDTVESDISINGNGAGVTVINGEFNVNSGGSEKVTAAFRDLSIGDFNINSGFGSSTLANLTNIDVVNDGLNINSGFNGSKTTATLTNVKVTGGAGIGANAGQSTTRVTITNSTVTGSSVEPLSANDTGTTVTVFGSTFAHNHDGIDATSGATINMTNSTVTGAGEQGVRSNGRVNLQNVTITKNTGGAVAALSGSMSIGNSILTDNALGGEGPTECAIQNATFVSRGGNVSDDASCHAVAGDHANTNAKLGSLAANGGPTQTFKPLTGSAAIDGGVAAGCPATDQRGVGRPQDGNGDGKTACDSGSVEIAAAPVVQSTTSTTPAGTTPTTAATHVTAAATPTTAPGAAQLPRTGGASTLLAIVGFTLLLTGASLAFGRRRAQA